MKQVLRMTATPALALMAMAFASMTTPASAGEFCVTNSSGMRSCGYATIEQCRATVSGVYGSCYRDPYLPDNSNALAQLPKSSHAKPVRKPVGNQ
jgi:hypothetical protein